MEDWINRHNEGILLVMFAATVFFWDSLLIMPIKLFVVVLHEWSHALAVVFTGGQIVRIEISEYIGGACYFQGGDLFLIASAGYLGSMLWGGLLLIFAVRSRSENFLGVLIGIFLMILACVYVRNFFGLVFTAGFGGFLLILGVAARRILLGLFLKYVSMVSCLYVIIDIKHDLIDISGVGSDADRIAELLGSQSSSSSVGFVWIITAILAFAFFLWIAGRGELG